jgi:hypothetical protein
LLHITTFITPRIERNFRFSTIIRDENY